MGGMVLFDHSVKCTSTVDPELNELETLVVVNYRDAFGVKQSTTITFREINAKTFDSRRVKLTGTGTTGTKIHSGGVLSVRDRVVDILSGAQFFTCDWIDKELPQVTEVVNFFETLDPHDGSPTIVATKRDCLHPQLVSINILILGSDLDISNPKLVIQISPYTGKVL